MLQRRDRKDLAVLALNVFVFGVVGAPLLHLVHVHGGGSGHAVLSHRTASAAPSPFGALEHATGAHSHGHDESVPHHHQHPEGGDAPAPHHHAPLSVEHLAVAALEPHPVPPPTRYEVAVAFQHRLAARDAIAPRYRPTSMPQAP